MLTFSLLFTGYISDTVGPLLSGATLKLECAQACVNNANCSSFFSDAITQECYLEKYVYIARNQLFHERGVQYYSLLNSACPANYIYCRFTNHCLRPYTFSSLHFPAAKALCLGNSGHLVFIRSEESNKQASIVARNTTVWIGLERDIFGWNWTNGHSLGPFINWRAILPRSLQMFGTMFDNGKWGAFSIANKLGALCEIDVEEDYALGLVLGLVECHELNLLPFR